MSARYHDDDDEGDDISISDAPTSIDPYAILSVPQDASLSQINSAYRKAALRCHPDKVSESEKEIAHAKFQEVAFAFAVLSDQRRRSRYDATGSTAESLDLEDDDFNWREFFAEQFRNAVTFESIDSFASEYKGSEEERGHVLQAYKKGNGSMAKVFQGVMLSDPVEDEARFRGIIDQAIEDGEVGAYSNYVAESEKSKRGRMKTARKHKNREAKEAEQAKKEMEEEKASKLTKSGGKKKAIADGNTGDLAAIIQQRQQGRANNFFDRLEEKYAPKKGKKGAKRPVEDELPEEAFEASRKLQSADGVTKGASRRKRSKRGGE